MNPLWNRWMQRALHEARRGTGDTGPNPLVGCVVVRDGEIVATGRHERVGGPHAEVVALREAGDRAMGADLFVTLEPCSHHGRTPPCTERILESGVSRVVVGTLDPNPKERGRSLGLLRARGVECFVGVESEETRAVNEPYFKYILTRRPYVTLKLAVSMDGRIATSSGDSQWLSGKAALRFVHRLRRDSNAVLVGGGTARSDDPRLTVRLARPVTNPLRVVLSRGLDLPGSLSLLSDEHRHRTVVFHGPGADASRQERLREAGVRLEEVGEGERGVELGAVMDRLGAMEVSRLLVEGGGRLAGELLAEGLVDRVILVSAPVLLGSRGLPAFEVDRGETLAAIPRGELLWTRRMGEDIVGCWRVGENWIKRAFDGTEGSEK